MRRGALIGDGDTLKSYGKVSKCDKEELNNAGKTFKGNWQLLKSDVEALKDDEEAIKSE